MIPETTPRLDEAEHAWLEGDDARAERSLIDACGKALTASSSDRAIVSLAFARYAACLDEDEVARELVSPLRGDAHIDEPLRGWAGLVWCASGGELSVEELRGIRLRVRTWQTPFADRIAACGARAAITRALIEEARAWVELGDEIVMSPAARITLLEAAANTDRAAGLEDSANARIDLAARLAGEQGWTRCLARLQLRRAMGTGGEPMRWISSAASVLLQRGTWRDRLVLREALRTHGRRMADRVMGEQAALPLARLDRAVSSVRMAGLLAVTDLARGGAHADQTCNAMLGRIRQLSQEIATAETDLNELVSEALVARDRTERMVRALASLEDIKTPLAYANAGAKITAELLEAERVWLVESSGDGHVQVMGSHPTDAPPPDWQGNWDATVGRLQDEGRIPRRRASLGTTLAVPIEARPLRGALLLDKGNPERRFRDDDRVLAALLGSQLAHGLARMRWREAERVAHTRLAATFGAIRDGVLAVGAKGEVRSANAAAARMLRLDEGEIVRVRLPDVDHVRPLWDVLSGSMRVDSTLVRLGHGTVVVTSRPVEGTDEGMVVTLVELGRAEMMARQITAARPRYTFDDIVGSSDEMREALRLARLAAEVDATLLITGESGTGKEMIAQAVHTGGPRAHQPFLGINCAALPRDLLEAELFGYERGAFTGARQGGQAGKFEQVGQGTLLLDEIGDMPLDMQAKLLRVLQERVVARLGSAREHPVQARIISTTHRNLEEAVGRSMFRLDLLFRLRVLHLHIPPLRNRPADIPELAHHFLRMTAQPQRKRVRLIGPQALRRLEGHDWPGNVRELANVIEREVTLLPGDSEVLDTIRGPLAGEWPTEEAPSVRSWALGALAERGTHAQPSAPSSGPRSMADVERETYLAALETHGNVIAAANALGVSKSQFYAKLKRWREDGLIPGKRRSG